MSESQRSLFDTTPDPWELDSQADRCIARIVFAEGLAGIFDYLVPDHLRSEVVAGKRVLVPLGRGNHSRLGYCVEVAVEQNASRRLKQIERVTDDFPLLSPAMLQLTRWMSDYYLSSWGRVLESVVPAGVRSQAGTRMLPMFSVPTRILARLSELKLPNKQAAILQYLAKSATPRTKAEICAALQCTEAPLRSLHRKELVVCRKERVASLQEFEESVEAAAPISLNAAQQAALQRVADSLQSGAHRTLLLHGVTGSGKTEVYIKAIEHVVSFRRQAIVLVPEISLTPQTQRRFRARFPNVAVLHSHLSDRERNWHWQRIARGEVQVIVGARSAIFAPTPHLGLIILDEEHDASFKQDSVPRYHARDVARRRAETESIPLILGSATPSLESWHLTQQGNADLLEMPRRVLDLPMPDVVLLDLRHELQGRSARGAISRRLWQAIKQAIVANEQVILLLNRRGFSTHIQCPACGHVVRCPNCELSLTHHREGEKAICHYCDYQVKAPPVCPECRFEGIRYGGLGTQRLEAEVRARFPEASVIRMDSDTMRRPGSHEESLDRFRRGEVSILVGTQMIAKGLDFPNVTVVGVINADTALHLPDFRAAERTFQLVTQVAGRTGRGMKGGRVFVQTYNPEHPAIQAAERHDYHRFAAQELPIRQQFHYPPFGRMLRIIVRGPIESQVEQVAEALAARLETLEGKVADYRVLGPAAAPMAKLRGNFRYHMIVQAADLDPIRTLLLAAQNEVPLPEEVQWQADIDPQEML
jgi:primosomal protein N' (replication factor Y)